MFESELAGLKICIIDERSHSKVTNAFVRWALDTFQFVFVVLKFILTKPKSLPLPAIIANIKNN